MPTHRSALTSLPFFLVFVLVLAQSAWLYRNGGPDNAEHATMVPHLLSHQSLLPKLFDIEHCESPPSRRNFQARELSYLFDYLDLQLLLLFARHGLAHFLSLIKYLFVAAILVLGWTAFTRDFALPKPIAALLLLLFLLSPPVYHGDYIHHCAKIGVALFAFAFLVWVHRFAAREEGAPRLPDALTALALLSGLALFDMQGFFLCLLATAILARLALADRRFREVFLSAAAATAIHLLYRYRVGYELIHYFHGYRPQSGFQDMQWRLLQSPRDLGRSVRLFLEYFRLFLGSVPYPVAGLALAGILAYQLRAGTTGLVFGLVTLGLVTMTFLMATHFYLVYLPEMTLIYYSLPCTAIFLFGLALTLKRAWREGPWGRAGITAALIFLVAGSYRALPAHRRVLEGASQGSSPYMAAMVKALRSAELRPLSDRMARDPVFLSLRREIRN